MAVAPLRWSGARWAYTCVVRMLAWPSNSCTVRRSEPPASRCVAKLCRNVCGLTVRLSPARNAYFAYGVAVVYIRASGETIDDSFELWRDLITDIRALRLTVYDIADRLRSWSGNG